LENKDEFPGTWFTIKSFIWQIWRQL